MLTTTRVSLPKFIYTLALTVTFSTYTAIAQNELFKLDLDQLTKIKVTSVAKTDQNALDAPAAVYVLTNNDIRRAGVTNVADALRLVPGMQVSQYGSNQWAITARGPESLFANKLLVLVDGRSVYVPSFGGVYWGNQDIMLEDIERIEVIRGPGASIWGANAVNGVINIISKSSKDTKGGLVVAGGGGEQRSILHARQGGTLSDETSYRVYGSRSQTDSFNFENGTNGGDGWERASVGFRTDTQYKSGSHLMLTGEIMKANSSEFTALPMTTPPYGALYNDQNLALNTHLIAKYDSTLSEDTSYTTQVYYDRAYLDRSIMRDRRDTFDAELGFQTKWLKDNVLTYGTHYRANFDDIHTRAFAVTPSQSQVSLADAYIQNDTPVLSGQGHIILGTKIEYNDYTGVEIQPTARVSYKPKSNQTIWSAVSRAVRTPTRISDGIDVYSAAVYNPEVPFPIIPHAVGNKGLSAEEIFSYELGYRYEPSKIASIDIALFYTTSRDLIGSRDSDSYFEPHYGALVVPTTFVNAGSATSSGIEVASHLHPWEPWDLALGFTFLDYNSDFPLSTERFIDTQNNAVSRYRFFARSSWKATENLTFDTILRQASNMGYYNVDSYLQLDQQLSLTVCKDVTFSVIGRNLLDQGQVEIGPEFFSVGRLEVPRSVFGKLEVRF